MDKNIKKIFETKNCDTEDSLVYYDVMSIMAGKWRLIIIGAILHQKLRYTDIHKMLPSITPRMLSKELKELELNGIVIRTVKNTIPVTIEYSLSDSANKLEPIFMQLWQWGKEHRNETMKTIKRKK